MRILVIEDEKKIASFIKRGLKEEGYVVDTASDGEEGHFVATTHEFDLIILDLMLPKLDGITLCKKLRDENIKTPVIMLTAKSGTQDKIKGLDIGADDYVTKPFDFQELLARTRTHLRKRESSSTQLQVADLTVNLLTHKVERAGLEIILTSKEFILLQYLIRNRDTVVTRTMISEHAWDINFDISSNVIDVYINYLRHKIDEQHPKKLIKTIRGRGYLLEG
ncbi:MAG: response regulator transcription factor [Chlamydiae bacterium]|nr:response regulator transcription factor [Chlamydiota bacterium]MBI3267003.1 response regulator transcription factor [Chlamydiota bacterium]